MQKHEDSRGVGYHARRWGKLLMLGGLAVAFGLTIAVRAGDSATSLADRIGSVESGLSSATSRYESVKQRFETLAAQWLADQASGASSSLGSVGERGAPGRGMFSHDAGEAMSRDNAAGKTIAAAGSGSAGAGIARCYEHAGGAETVVGSNGNGDGIIKLTFENGQVHTLIAKEGTTHYNTKGMAIAFLGDAGNGDGRIELANTRGESLVQIDTPTSGPRIWAKGSDMAEVFEFSGGTHPDPGTLVCIDPAAPGSLEVCDGYATGLAAGVVSADVDPDGLTPAMILGRRADGSMDHPVALAGRVRVRADTSRGPIRPGDLLVSSDTPGQVCRLDDPLHAVGTTVGKAVEALDEGEGTIQMLVMLR